MYQVMKLGTGMPAFNNDEIIIPSFIDLGVKEKMLIIIQQLVVLKQLFLGNGDIVVQECHIKISKNFISSDE